MAEVDIDITREFPKPWTDEIVQAADVVVTMGCGDACPFFPGSVTRTGNCPIPRDNRSTLFVRSVTTSKSGSAPAHRTQHHPRQLTGISMTDAVNKPSVLFVCVKNACSLSWWPAR